MVQRQCWSTISTVMNIVVLGAEEQMRQMKRNKQIASATETKKKMQNCMRYHTALLVTILQWTGWPRLLMEWILTVVKHSTTSWRGMHPKTKHIVALIHYGTGCVFVLVQPLLAYFHISEDCSKSLALGWLQTFSIIWKLNIDRRSLILQI